MVLETGSNSLRTCGCAFAYYRKGHIKLELRFSSNSSESEICGCMNEDNEVHQCQLFSTTYCKIGMAQLPSIVLNLDMCHLAYQLANISGRRMSSCESGMAASSSKASRGKESERSITSSWKAWNKLHKKCLETHETLHTERTRTAFQQVNCM